MESSGIDLSHHLNNEVKEEMQTVVNDMFGVGDVKFDGALSTYCKVLYDSLENVVSKMPDIEEVFNQIASDVASMENELFGSSQSEEQSENDTANYPGDLRVARTFPHSQPGAAAMQYQPLIRALSSGHFNGTSVQMPVHSYPDNPVHHRVHPLSHMMLRLPCNVAVQGTRMVAPVTSMQSSHPGVYFGGSPFSNPSNVLPSQPQKSPGIRPNDLSLYRIESCKLTTQSLYIGLQVLGLQKDEWNQGVIIDIQQLNHKIKYKIQFQHSKDQRFLAANCLSCLDTNALFAKTPLLVGSRVAANFRNDGLFSAIVAESASRLNRNRYLLFFDDGYAMYCEPKHVYLVFGPQLNVWTDISHKGTADYIKEFLSRPSEEKPMLSLSPGQSLKVEFEGVWHRARCATVDNSLVEVRYLSDGSTEWIYRGSMRLGPLHKQYHLKQRSERRVGPNQTARAHTGARKNRIEFVQTIDLTEDATDDVPPSTFTPQADDSMFTKPNVAAGQWEAPWDRPLAEQKTTESQQTAPTRLPQSYSEMSGRVDVASHLINRLKPKQLRSRFKSDSESSRSEVRNALTPEQFSSRSRPRINPELVPDDFIEADVGSYVTKASPAYVPHTCSQRCVAHFGNTAHLKGANPLMRPLMSGWTREICKLRSTSHRPAFHMYYRTPCGRCCRNMQDVERYILQLRITYLDFDHFSFDHSVRTHSKIKLQPDDTKYFLADYSGGKEDMAISCVNEISREPPPRMPYTKIRIEGKGVSINTDPDYMVCCDCPDNCRDRSKCPCQQLTVQATTCSGANRAKQEAGYQYKRLHQFLQTGIFECNAGCKCNWMCRNRVVQKGLQCRLQLFKTHKKGWGIRCLDDIALGTFVCIYTGKIQTESNADSEGRLNGDEYLAELDYIEAAERSKAEYSDGDDDGGFDSALQSDADDSDSSDEMPPLQLPTPVDAQAVVVDDDDDDDKCVDIRSTVGRNREVRGGTPMGMGDDEDSNGSKRKRKGRQQSGRAKNPSADVLNSALPIPPSSNYDDDTTDTDSDSEPPSTQTLVARRSTSMVKVKKSKFEPQSELDTSNDEDRSRTRRLYGSDGMFIIDAKQTGNLGRYLNHSCTPNLMVQNVFIDTHDLRFPWVAFFANTVIRAGTELTWDYSYEVGSVPGRVVPCYCGSTKCRKRLL